MPGAVRSGLTTSAAAGFGPREEKLAIDGAFGQLHVPPVLSVTFGR